MCVACVGAATPEVAVAVGAYAAVRFGRPLSRIKARWAERAAQVTAGDSQAAVSLD